MINLYTEINHIFVTAFQKLPINNHSTFDKQLFFIWWLLLCIFSFFIVKQSQRKILHTTELKHATELILTFFYYKIA